MKLYDSLIQQCNTMLEKQDKITIHESIQKSDWEDVGDYNMILRSDMAYELGGGTLPAVSGLAFTSSKEFVGEDEVVLYGPDLSEISKDSPYARLTFLRVEEELEKKEQAYGILRNIEYTRYHIHPKGYMMRISVTNDREPVRISKEAIRNGISFQKVGGMFVDGYHKHKEVLGVKVIYITLPEFPYEKLTKIACRMDGITESLDHIFHNLKMDCSVCALKKVCDEVDGLRELHRSMESQ